MTLRATDRRTLLRGTVLAGLAAMPLERALASATARRAAVAAEAPRVIETGLRRMLTEPERAFLRAAVDRIIPPDPDWPGAADLGVVDFIDDQLAGPFGRGQDWYMEGPWAEGTKEQGYQSRHAPAALYRLGIAATDAQCNARYGKAFAALDPAQQDEVLKGLESGDIALEGVGGATFFDLLRQNTVEGFFGDPLYGGNRDMQAWRMIGFPGARYDYRPFVERHNTRLDLEPVSLLGPSATARNG